MSAKSNQNQMSGEPNQSCLKFSPFVSCVNPSFWHKLTQLKLEVDKLNENVHRLWGYYSNKSPQDFDSIFSLDCSSWNREPDQYQTFGFGSIINKNTIESFKEEDKAKLLDNEGKALVETIKKDAIENPSLLTRFVILSFADLKKYHYYYWFAFLAPNFLSCSLFEKSKGIADLLSESCMSSLCDLYNKTNLKDKSFFLIHLLEEGVQLYTIKNGLLKYRNDGKWFFGFTDPCNKADYPGWPLRNILAFISYHFSAEVHEKPVPIISLRLSFSENGWSVKNSRVYTLLINIEDGVWEKPMLSWVGWERNERGRMGPRFSNLSSSLDPVRLAETSVDLNLKLMKWQLLPELDLDVIKNTKCLLLGAGTLGCVVSRNLLSWGVQQITFVDNGKVSYSNPVRQFLYKFKDCNAPKALTAAQALREIFPGVKSEGYVISIPMPGHPVGDSLLQETRNNIEKLEQLIKLHDVVFLLMDSRESRWLPTLLAAAEEKLAINAALGFDSYLVMRHGLKVKGEISSDVENISGSNLGCYFCNDVTAPGNSGRSRTLDQQCTVTRPGVSNIAGALAVELLASILQHPLKGLAPAESDQEQLATSSSLGIIPHSIRGFISNFQTVLPATEAFSSCVACSTKVVEEYKAEGFNFILKALESKEYLENLSGLTNLYNEKLMSEVLEYTSSESESS